MNTIKPHSSPPKVFPGIFFAFLVLGLFIPLSASAEKNCTELLVKRCETCHYMTRVCQKIDRERNKKSWFGRGKGSSGTWKRTITNMTRQGAQLNKAEENILVECLSKPTPEVLNLCNLDK